MQEIRIGANELVESLLGGGRGERVCILDSCGVGRKEANLLIAGVDPVNTVFYSADQGSENLAELENLLANRDLAAIFTLSYDLGLSINGVTGRSDPDEPGIYVALFDRLVIHDYSTGRTVITGDPQKYSEIVKVIRENRRPRQTSKLSGRPPLVNSTFTQAEYTEAVVRIKELIRSGETYQTNLTQQLKATLSSGVTAPNTFMNLRRDHPAQFAAYIDREDSIVVSASPEQFFRIERRENGRKIVAEPIKGTRRRGGDVHEDHALRSELLNSAKDRAENTMIVDLMRNDLGRICNFGTIVVDDLCRIEEHPTLFHLVSTVSGMLRDDVDLADIIKAVYPCGSITGAPKIRTMELIEQIEPQARGLSMGAIGCRIPGDRFGTREILEMSVAIRTIVFRGDSATMNVGGGIVIDSDPHAEYAESMLKAEALLKALHN